MIGLFYLLFFYFAGNCVSSLVGNFIPGSVIGMMLLFVALCLRIVKPDDLREICHFLLNNIVLFFIPVGVGLMASYHLISEHIWAIVVSSVVSTLLIIAGVGWLQQYLERKFAKTKKTDKERCHE